MFNIIYLYRYRFSKKLREYNFCKTLIASQKIKSGKFWLKLLTDSLKFTYTDETLGNVSLGNVAAIKLLHIYTLLTLKQIYFVFCVYVFI